MANKDLLKMPATVKTTNGSRSWMYEEATGFTIAIEPESMRTEIIHISWSKIRQALARLDKKPARKKPLKSK